ncbi:MAG: hypothetical protein ABJB47_04730 [Actinomycetota bacterium]
MSGSSAPVSWRLPATVNALGRPVIEGLHAALDAFDPLTAGC